MPGQPSFFEAAPSVVVLIAGLFSLFRKRDKRLPWFVSIPLLTWIGFSCFYAVLSVSYDFRIGLIAIMTRVVPILMCLIAFKAVNEVRDIVQLSLIFSLLAILLLLPGIVVFFKGNEFVPYWLRPNIQLVKMGRTIRGDVQVYAGIFTSQAVLATSFLAAFYLILSIIHFHASSAFKALVLKAGLVSSGLLVFISTKRAAFFVVIIGIFYNFLIYPRKNRLLRIFLMVVLGALFAVAITSFQFNLDASEELQSRYELATSVNLIQRVRDVFGKLVFFWVEKTPLGSYLGSAGPEGREFGTEIRALESVETGGALLIAETGLLGAILMPTIVFFMYFPLLRRKGQEPTARAISVLFLFHFFFYAMFYMQGSSLMTAVTVAHLFFWSVPGAALALIERKSMVPLMFQKDPQRRRESNFSDAVLDRASECLIREK